MAVMCYERQAEGGKMTKEGALNGRWVSRKEEVKARAAQRPSIGMHLYQERNNERVTKNFQFQQIIVVKKQA